jgi:outer membrane protein insertion porin family
VNYVRTDLETGWFHGITKDIIFSGPWLDRLRVRLGGDEVRINDRIYKGA